jgi:hypothetical protein
MDHPLIWDTQDINERLIFEEVFKRIWHLKCGGEVNEAGFLIDLTDGEAIG